MGEYDEKGSTVMAKELLDVKQLFVNVEDKVEISILFIMPTWLLLIRCVSS